MKIKLFSLASLALLFSIYAFGETDKSEQAQEECTHNFYLPSLGELVLVRDGQREFDAAALQIMPDCKHCWVTEKTGQDFKPPLVIAATHIWHKNSSTIAREKIDYLLRQLNFMLTTWH